MTSFVILGRLLYFLKALFDLLYSTTTSIP
nr:MAG TPA: hypothetical protein [Caudoviricetes sp.]